MALEVTPEPADSELAAIRIALKRAGVRVDGQAHASASAWRRAALRDAVGDDAELGPETWPEPYALSPRSTRGATRA